MSISRDDIPVVLKAALEEAIMVRDHIDMDIVTATLTLAACVNELTVAVREIDNTLMLRYK
jgi:hypothetical protein